MNPASVGILSHVVQYLAVGHHIYHYLGWIGCSPEAADNVWMLQSHPHGDLLVKCLVIMDYANEK